MSISAYVYLERPDIKMKNPNIATMLKYYRKLNELSVNDVSEQLKQHNNFAAPKTIYGWETGHTQPDADTLMLLCELYHIEDVLEKKRQIFRLLP